jgi:hypothetical protein
MAKHKFNETISIEGEPEGARLPCGSTLMRNNGRDTMTVAMQTELQTKAPALCKRGR